MAKQTLFFVNNYTVAANTGQLMPYYEYTAQESDLYAASGSNVQMVAAYDSSPAFEPQTGPYSSPMSSPQYTGPDVPLYAIVAGKVMYLTLPDLSQQTAAIWSYDGTYLNQITSGHDYVLLAAFGNDLVFTEDSAASSNDTLAIYNPSTKAISQPRIPDGGYYPTSFITLDGKLYFEAFDASVGRWAIYSYDGSRVIEQYNSATNPVAGPLVAYNGHIYYGSTSSSIDELAPSLSQLGATSTDVATVDPSKPSDSPTNFIVANDRLYFLAGSGGIFSIDASNHVAQLAGVSGVFNPVAYDHKLYFVADDSNGVQNLYTTTGDTVTEIATNFSGSDFVVAGDTLYFASSAGLGTINGTNINVVGLPGGGEIIEQFDAPPVNSTGAGNPLVAAPFTPISWGLPYSTVFDGGGSPVLLDGELNLLENAIIPSATVRIGNFLAGDTLDFTNQNGITGTYDPSIGVLTLTGKANTAAYQAALDSITYSFSPADGDPTDGGRDLSRAITWSIAGIGELKSSLATVHTPPSINVSGSATFVGGRAPVAPETSLAVSDADSGGNLTGATVSIASGFINGDTLYFTNQKGITGHYDAATGVLKLIGTASVADYQATLASITYSPSPADGDPTGGGTHLSRTIDWVVSDGNSSNGISNIGSTTVTDVHVGPILTVGTTATFIGGDSPVPLNSLAAITDPDSGGDLVSATIRMRGFIRGDALVFVDQNGITGDYDATLGVLTLAGKASIADYQTALRSVSCGFTPGGDPTGGGKHTSRLLSWVVNDGVDNSPVVTSALSVVHAPPTVAASGTVTYAAGAAAVAIDPDVAIADPDSAGNLTGAVVAISSGLVAGDTLAFAAQHGITGSYDSTNGTLTLSGTASVADYQAALASISFESTAADPTSNGTDLSRTISWTVSDGVATSAAATSIVDVTQSPPASTGTTTVTITNPSTGQTETVTITLSRPANGTNELFPGFDSKGNQSSHDSNRFDLGNHSPGGNLAALALHANPAGTMHVLLNHA